MTNALFSSICSNSHFKPSTWLSVCLVSAVSLISCLLHPPPASSSLVLFRSLCATLSGTQTGRRTFRRFWSRKEVTKERVTLKHVRGSFRAPLETLLRCQCHSQFLYIFQTLAHQPHSAALCICNYLPNPHVQIGTRTCVT